MSPPPLEMGAMLSRCIDRQALGICGGRIPKQPPRRYCRPAAPFPIGGNAIEMRRPAGMGDLRWLKAGTSISGPEATRQHRPSPAKAGVQLKLQPEAKELGPRPSPGKVTRKPPATSSPTLRSRRPLLEKGAMLSRCIASQAWEICGDGIPNLPSRRYCKPAAPFPKGGNAIAVHQSACMGDLRWPHSASRKSSIRAPSRPLLACEARQCLGLKPRYSRSSRPARFRP